jgi:hypothetical protein
MKAAVLALLLAPAVLAGQEPRDPRSVRPERPTVATHAYPVAPGILEIESGVEVDRFDDRSHAVLAPTNVKLGLSSRAQLNVYLPLAAPGGASLGVGDVGAGVKWQLVEGHPVLGSFAVLPALKAPSGSASAGRGTGTTDVSLTLISSREIGPVSLDLNVAGTLRSGDGTAAPRHATLWTASFGIPVSGRLGWALELFGYPATSGPAGTPAYSAVLTGPALVGRRLAVDAGIIVPFAGRQTFGLYAGAVWNAARLWTSERRLPNP